MQRFGPVYVHPSGDAVKGRSWERAACAETAKSAARTSSIVADEKRRSDENALASAVCVTHARECRCGRPVHTGRSTCI